MSKVTKKDRITHLELQVGWLTNVVHELRGTENLEFEPHDSALKKLTQSIFDGLDEKWRFAAVNEAGEVFRFSKEPKLSDSFIGAWVVRGLFNLEGAGTGYDTSNWQNSLIERDTAKELTGSDLARAMLARGDKYVMCAIGDVSDADALDSMVVDNAMSSNEDWFDCLDGRLWRYAVPINNQGEPLTQAEVGL